MAKMQISIPRAPASKQPAYKPPKMPAPYKAPAPSGASAKESARETGRATRAANRAANKVERSPGVDAFSPPKGASASRSTPKGTLPGRIGAGKSPLSKLFK